MATSKHAKTTKRTKTSKPAKTTKRVKTAKAAKPAKKKSTKSDAESRVRELCLALPEAHEVEAWGAPTYRVKNKVFAMFIRPANHHHDGRPAVWICSTHVEQDLVVRARPTLYFKPPYVGPSGWIGAFLDGKPPWMEINELLREGYRRRAPKKLAALLGE